MSSPKLPDFPIDLVLIVHNLTMYKLAKRINYMLPAWNLNAMSTPRVTEIISDSWDAVLRYYIRYRLVEQLKLLPKQVESTAPLIRDISKYIRSYITLMYKCKLPLFSQNNYEYIINQHCDAAIAGTLPKNCDRALDITDRLAESNIDLVHSMIMEYFKSTFNNGESYS